MYGQTNTFTWVIKNFSLSTKAIGQAIETSPFSTGIETDPQCIALFHPRTEEDPASISFFLQRVDTFAINKELCATFRLLDVDGVPCVQSSPLTGVILPETGFGMPILASRAQLQSLCIHNDTLRLQCVIGKTKKESNVDEETFRTTGVVTKAFEEWSLTNFSQTRQSRVLEGSLTLALASELHFCLSIEGKPGHKAVIVKFIRRCGLPGEPLSMNTLITVLDVDGKESDIWKRAQHVFRMGTPEEIWQFPNFISKSPIVRRKDKYLLNDVLKLKCEITLSLGTTTCLSKNAYLKMNVCDTPAFENLAKDMKYLYNSKWLADVKLRVIGETVPVHAIVLQSRSKRFAELLDQEREDEEVLDVHDVGMVSLKRILKYMYTDEIDDLEFNDALEDYITAHTYQIDSLKCKYFSVLQSQLNATNVCDFLAFADDICDQDLKDCAVDIAKQYWGRVCLSEKWKILLKERPSIAKQTVEQLNLT